MTGPPEDSVVICEMVNGNFIVAVYCPDCYCIIMRKGICHHCPEKLDYINEEEFAQHRNFITHLVKVYDPK